MITITGGIISKQRDSLITFKFICDKCGNTGSSENSVNVTKGVTEISTKKCSSCCNNQVIKLKQIVAL